MTTLRTERLELRPFAEADLDDLHALFTDADVRRFLLDDEVVSRGWVADEIQASAERFDERGCGLWCVREATGEELAGFVGYRPFFEPPELQLLYGFRAAWWGRGLATEAATEAVRYAFEELGFDEIRAATDPPNEASVRVLERLGMERCAAGAEAPPGTLFFRLARADWAAGHPARQSKR